VLHLTRNGVMVYDKLEVHEVLCKVDFVTNLCGKSCESILTDHSNLILYGLI
jgi:hypothetical protein